MGWAKIDYVDSVTYITEDGSSRTVRLDESKLGRTAYVVHDDGSERMARLMERRFIGGYSTTSLDGAPNVRDEQATEIDVEEL